jgi:hypothetical protein
MPYRNWDRMNGEAQKALLAQAAGFLEKLGLEGQQ